jgi:2-oxoglutarate/2-oxoacid ferredoxin oxidoreductase subunit alpha
MKLGDKMKYNILFGGKAGQGPNALTHLFGDALVKLGYYVFYSRDYQSLIRGGHNFNVITFSDKPVHSNDSKMDVMIALDETTINKHKKEMKKEGIILSGRTENMYYAGRLFKLLGISFKILGKALKLLKKRFEDNLRLAKEGYKDETREICKIVPKKNNNFFMDGNDGISEGAIKSGLDTYFAYPMTPATSVLGKLASRQIEKNYFVFEMENELAVVNAAVGSAVTGAKAMVGTSGGGFDLMTETLSLTGIAEIPLIFFLSQRPGPGTGVPTYNQQGDLNIARHGGHGEFQRVVLAPGDPKEAEELTNQAFYFAHKYKIPSVVISDKHLGESMYSLSEKSKISKVPKTTKLARFNSYEKDSDGCSTEDSRIIVQNINKRKAKEKLIIKDAKQFSQFEIYGKRDSKNVILSWGSTKGAIIDSIVGLDVKFVQIKYIEPFPEKIKKELEGKNVIIIENNSSGQLQSLVGEKTGINIAKKILRYDGRPFLCDELAREIKELLK